MPTDQVAVAAAGALVAPSGRSGASLLLPAVGLAALAAFVALAVADGALYKRVIDLWSFHPEVSPFVDLEGPLAWIRCWRDGMDVFLETTCDIFDRPLNYSPLILHLPLPTVQPESKPAYGVLLAALFFVSLAVLPRPRTRSGAALLLLALFSPFCMFGLERGNLDLLMFAAVAFAVLCLERGLSVRLLGYAVIVAAGLLKFYPWVLLLLLLRERPVVFLLASSVFAVVLGSFVVGYHDELGRVLDNLPQLNPFQDAFGASQLANGLVIVTHGLHAPPDQGDTLDVVIGWGITLVVYGAVLASAVLLARGAALQRALGRLSAREAQCLTVSAVVMCGCFFAGASIGYRAVMLLFALPGLLVLAREADDWRLAWLVRGALAAAFLLIWSLPIQRLINRVFGQFWVPTGSTAGPVWTPVPGLAFWVLREALWWWLMLVLLAIVMRMILASRIWNDALRWVAKA